ncbi:MAG: hypothetical protein HFJ47_02305 [Clostridia bacterium]|nr:hypothetical protein [Clostridia bacterium]
MNIVLYIIIFILGIIIGSFYKFILNKKSIKLQIATGILSILFAIGMNLNINNIKTSNIITLGFIMLYLAFIVLISSIDKEKRKIEKTALAYGIAISVIYIIYLCIMEKSNIYRYPIYLVLIAILLVIDNINTKKKAEDNYTISILMFTLIMVIFTGEYISILTIAATLLAVAIYLIINKIRKAKRNTNKENVSNIRIGWILSTINIAIFIVNLLCINFQR